MELNYVPFDRDQIKIDLLYKSKELNHFSQKPLSSQKVRYVYGDDLMFPEAPTNRPYLFSSFVMSIDGRMAYHDEPSAFYVAAKNEMAGGGKDTDFWVLNALRAVCDGALIGGNSMATDADYAMYCMDEDVAKDREAAGLSKYPLNIIMTLDATDVPLDHGLLENTTIPAILVTSPKGREYLEENYKKDMLVVTDRQPLEEIKKALSNTCRSILPVLVSGEGRTTDSKSIMKILKDIGIEKLLIESPGYGHHLIKEKMLDEIFLNKSGVYIGGGDTMVMGKNDKGFLSSAHPHMRVLSVHMYNEYFMFFRYKFNYENM